MEFKDYYQILGVSRDASQDEIKRAYRKLARKYHPDVSEESDAEQRFKEISEAYEVLRDPEKRAAYDQVGSEYQAGEDFRPPPGWEQGFEFGGGGFTGADADAFSEFFESLFGGLGGMGGRQRGAGPFGGDFRSPAQDQHARVQISLEDAYHGGTRQLSLTVPERDSSGRVRQSTRTLNVKIPAGIREGQQIRLPGQGNAGADGRAGDLYLEVEFAPHPRFRAEGRDIHMTLPVTPWEAALGATVSVPTLGGSVDMKIPEGTQSGRKMRLKGRGLPGRPPGDQYAHIQIVVPKPRTQADRELLEQMAEQMPMNPRNETERAT